MTRTRTRIFLAAVLLAGLTSLAYFPALRGGFVFDDDKLLTQNPLIMAPDGLYRFWFTSEPVDYWPMTMTSFWFESRLWGMDAAGYHVTNLLLHISSALMVWVILRRLGVPGSYWAALFFAVHPVNVQSVAWISQRKNTLSLFLFLTSTYCFLRSRWSDTPAGPSGGGAGSAGPDTRARAAAPSGIGAKEGFRNPPPSGLGKWYWLSLLAFALAMLAKGSVAILPLVLLGLIAWRRRLRITDLWRAAPFFAVAAILTLVNIQFQSHGVTAPVRDAGVVERLLGAAAVTVFYLWKALLPINLSFFYSLWRIRTDEALWWLPLLGVLGLTAFLWWMAGLDRATKCDAKVKAGLTGDGGGGRSARPDRHLWRGALFAWGYFCVALIPVMGFTDIYFMRYSLVADHYQYIALIGVTAFLAAAASGWGGEDAPRFRTPKIVAASAVAGVLAIMTWRQTGMYRDAETLYRVTLRRNPECWPADNNLGVIEGNSSRPDAAFAHFAEALRLNPDYAEAQFNLGLILKRRPNGAVLALPHFARAVQLNARYADAHFWLGDSLLDLGRADEAAGQFEEAIRLNTNFLFEAHVDFGVLLAKAGKLAEALPHFSEAVRLKPNVASAQLNLAQDLAGLGRMQEAQAHFAEAVRLDPGLERRLSGQ